VIWVNWKRAEIDLDAALCQSGSQFQIEFVSRSDNCRVLLCGRIALGGPNDDYYESSNPEKPGGVLMAREFRTSSLELQNAIRARAEELYRQGGGAEGHDVENWCRAEAEIMRETAAAFTHPAVVINVEGVVYTGEYDVASAGGYLPGEWKVGDRVPVRLEGDKLFLRRPNGRELETSVVKRIG
jgi:hypothetical protein